MIIKPKLIEAPQFSLRTCESCIWISTEGKWDVYFCDNPSCCVSQKYHFCKDSRFYIYDSRQGLYSDEQYTRMDLSINKDQQILPYGDQHIMLLKGARKYYDKYGY